MNNQTCCIVLLYIIFITTIAIFITINIYTNTIPILNNFLGMIGMLATAQQSINAIKYNGGSSSDVCNSCVANKQDSFIANKPYTVISDNAKIIVDGHNMIHSLLAKTNITSNEFNQTLDTISYMLLTALPTQDIHIIIKNPNNNIQNKNNYLLQIQALSNKYTNITYHIAYSQTSKKQLTTSTTHHLKGRDDLLTLYLAQTLYSNADSYILTLDKFKDASKFKDIQSFDHYIVYNNAILSKETIHPKNVPLVHINSFKGSMLAYEFTNSQATHGVIYINPIKKINILQLYQHDK